MKFDDIKAFGNMIFKARHACKGKERNLVEVGKGCGVSHTTVKAWEDGNCFPKEEKLPLLAKTLRLDLAELAEIWQSSKKAKETLRFKKASTKKGLGDQELFPGKIDKRTNLVRSNPHLPRGRGWGGN